MPRKFRHPLLALLLLCLVSIPQAARANSRDMVQFGNDIVVHEGEETHDVVCFLCSIEVDGTVNGDLVAFGGNLHIRGHAERDAVVFLGNLQLADNASVGKDAVVLAGTLRAGTSATVGGDRVVFPLVLFVLPLLFTLGILALIVAAVRWLIVGRRPAYPYPMPPPRM